MSDFWSRRRAAVAQETEAEQATHFAQEQIAAEQALEARSDEELLAEAGLPEPENLNSAEAVREFLGSALPQRLKTRALRQLWKMNPVLANLDGLIDYGEDFTDSATVIENLQTAYQVGKGMLSHVEALVAKTDETSIEVDEIVSVEPSDEDLIEAEAVEGMAAFAPAEPSSEINSENTANVPQSRRRMQFQFEVQA